MDKLESLEQLFAGRHFDRAVIILCVRWYLRFKLSLRLGRDDGGARPIAGTHNHRAMGLALHP
jgi:transposase-like protein